MCVYIYIYNMYSILPVQPEHRFDNYLYAGFPITLTTYVSTKHGIVIGCSKHGVVFVCFKLISDMQVAELIVRPPYEFQPEHCFENHVLRFAGRAKVWCFESLSVRESFFGGVFLTHTRSGLRKIDSHVFSQMHLQFRQMVCEQIVV